MKRACCGRFAPMARHGAKRGTVPEVYTRLSTHRRRCQTEASTSDWTPR